MPRNARVALSKTHAVLIGVDLSIASIRLRELAQGETDMELVDSLRKSREYIGQAEPIGPPAETVRIRYEIHADDLHSRGEVTLPSWCSGSPREAIALHFFGYVSGAIHNVTRAEIVSEPLRNKFGQAVDADGELLTIND